MNGREVADAIVEKTRREQADGILDWARDELEAKRQRGELLTAFEESLASKLWHFDEM
jgi:hypothetical protein